MADPSTANNDIYSVLRSLQTLRRSHHEIRRSLGPLTKHIDILCTSTRTLPSTTRGSSYNMHRKTRFVCVSDTHAYTPAEAGFKLPAGDVLIHAGDLTNHGSLSELRRTIDWIAKSDYEVKIIVAGNHDLTLDPTFYARHGTGLQKDHLEDPQECIEAITKASSSILYLRHESAVVRLSRPDGPKTVFKVFASPYSPSNGNWAFGYETADADALWGQIPRDTDLVVAHTPPYSHRDNRATGGLVGCAALRQVLQRVRPKLAVCGHVHESRGYERVRWISAGETDPAAKDQVVVVPGVLPSPGSKKQSLVDLTGKKAPRLDNLWSWAHGNCTTPRMKDRSLVSGSGSGSATDGNRLAMEKRQMTEYEGGGDHDDSDHAIRAQAQRQETCIVNAAIMGTSWPHRGGKRFNTPIVVDLELPMQKELSLDEDPGYDKQ